MVFGADDRAHPAVTYLHDSVQEFYVGGSVQAIAAPQHFDYVALRCASSPIVMIELKNRTDGSLSIRRLAYGAPRLLQQALVEARRRVPDAKPYAQGAQGAHRPRCPPEPRQRPHPPRRWTHQARRRRRLHPSEYHPSDEETQELTRSAGPCLRGDY